MYYYSAHQLAIEKSTSYIFHHLAPSGQTISLPVADNWMDEDDFAQAYTLTHRVDNEN